MNMIRRGDIHHVPKTLRNTVPSAIAVLLAALAVSPAASGAAGSGAGDAARCAALGNGTRIGHATVISSAHVSDGTARDATGAKYEGLNAYCRVTAVAAAAPHSNILIEVWLPDQARWNGRFLGTGNGAFAGAVSMAPLASGLLRGFAVANTDMGTFPAAQQGGAGQIGYAAGNGRPEAVRDWGFRSTHEMTLLAKALIKRFYGTPAQRSYFAGCSTGGHQALTEAQRFPEDYDGIIAGAAGHNRTHLHTMFLSQALVMQQPDFKLPSLASLNLWTDRWRAMCAGKDGGAPGDAYLTDPSRCSMKPRDYVCRPDQKAGPCIPPDELALLETMYAPTRNPRTGDVIYPAMAIGAEQTLIQFAHLMAAYKPRGVAAEIARWAFPPDWDATTFNFDTDMKRVDDALAADINANDPDLTRFAARGGKLILWHGWEDYLVSPYDSILYHDRAFAKNRQQGDFLRLFMVPGVGHCGGGAGPDGFGQFASGGSMERPAGPASHDMLVALQAWVESGQRPDRIVASKFDAKSPSGIAAQRPLCPYPSIARYSGNGAITDPENFVCTAAAPVHFERPSASYLR